MILIIGYIVVLAATIGGLYLGGGEVRDLLHGAEFIVVIGICLGILIIASPINVLVGIVRKTTTALKGTSVTRREYMEIMQLLYEIFMLGRRNGVIALEDHIISPQTSSIFQNYPGFLSHPARVEFLCNCLRPVIDGKVKPDQLEEVIETELIAMEEENDGPVRVLGLVGDSFPGVGICAAVLGIILTMSKIDQDPAIIGQGVANALTGTFIGVFGAYGFVNPLTTLIATNNLTEMKYYRCISTAVCAFAKGMAPIMAVELCRRSLDSHFKPSADELEEVLKNLRVSAKPN